LIKFYLQNPQYFIETNANFHELRCDALLTPLTVLRTLSRPKYIVEYPFLFPLVFVRQEKTLDLLRCVGLHA